MPALEYPPATMIVAALETANRNGESVEAEVAEDRPRRTIDVHAGDRTTSSRLIERRALIDFLDAAHLFGPTPHLRRSTWSVSRSTRSRRSIPAGAAPGRGRVARSAATALPSGAVPG